MTCANLLLHNFKKDGDWYNGSVREPESDSLR